MSKILQLSLSEADIEQVIDGLYVREKASECGGMTPLSTGRHVGQRESSDMSEQSHTGDDLERDFPWTVWGETPAATWAGLHSRVDRVKGA